MAPTETEPVDGPDMAVASISILKNLRDRREEIAVAQVLSERVPRWSDPEIWVDYKPVDFNAVDKVRREGSTKVTGEAESEMIFLANVDALIAGCIAVYAVLPDDDATPKTKYSLKAGDPTGALTKFDRDLGVNLGLNESCTARQVVRALFIADGDVLTHANKLNAFSGYAGQEANRLVGES